jgi:hypothetical protein
MGLYQGYKRYSHVKINYWRNIKGGIGAGITFVLPGSNNIKNNIKTVYNVVIDEEQNQEDNLFMLAVRQDECSYDDALWWARLLRRMGRCEDDEIDRLIDYLEQHEDQDVNEKAAFRSEEAEHNINHWIMALKTAHYKRLAYLERKAQRTNYISDRNVAMQELSDKLAEPGPEIVGGNSDE